jgi:flagellar basal body-associated protein FliL
MADNESKSGNDSGSDEIISLERLVSVEPPGPKKIAGAPAPATAGIAKAPAAGTGGIANVPSNPATVQSAQASLNATSANEEVDQLFALEDPAFAESLKDLADLGPGDVAADADLDSLVKKARAEAATKGPKKLYLFLIVRPARGLSSLVNFIKAKVLGLRTTAIPAIKAGASYTLVKSKSGAIGTIAGLKFAFGKFAEMSGAAKLKLFLVIGLAVATIAVGLFTFREHLLPSFQTNYVSSLDKIADAEYTFKDSDGWENLNDPYLHPEHMVLIERIISNLKPDSPTPNPMTMMELFIETSSQEAAVELRDREAEARDVIGRTLNQMPYDEMSTVNGKNKVKVFLRKDLNEMMTKGRVRRVFFKSLILKP